MKFFSEDQLEEFYEKSVDEISPTDNPLPYYIAGQGTIQCNWCNTQLQTHCKNTFTPSEVAYCEYCDLHHRRNRELVIDESEYEMQVYRTDEREEYICPDCKERHPLTVPVNDEFTNIEQPKLHSLESISVKCYCGNQIPLSDKNIPYSTYCERCNRELSISIQRK